VSRSQRRNDAITVGLLWHSVSSLNLGIGALTVSHLALLGEIAEREGLKLRFRAMGWQTHQPVYITRPDLEVFDFRAISLFDPWGLRAAVRGCDLVLDVSAGDSFSDIYGARRFLFNVLAKAVVIGARRPLIMSPQTIGPFQRSWARALALALIRRARSVVTRDRLTTAYLREQGISDNLVESTDLAFRLPFAPPMPRDGGPVRIGLNVSALLFYGGYTGGNMFSLAVDYARMVRALIARLRALPDVEVHLVGHVIGDARYFSVENDLAVSQMLAEEFPGLVVAPMFNGPSEAKGYIASMDFFIGSRMHSCIAAFSSGVPVLPIAYSRKFAGVFGSLGYDILADCETETEVAIVDKAIDAFNRRAELKELIARACVAADERLEAYENVLRQCLAEVSQSR